MTRIHSIVIFIFIRTLSFGMQAAFLILFRASSVSSPPILCAGARADRWQKRKSSVGYKNRVWSTRFPPSSFFSLSLHRFVHDVNFSHQLPSFPPPPPFPSYKRTP